MGLLLLGAIAMADFTVGLFFARFWKKTHDRFFLFFAISFFIEGVGRIMLALTQTTEQEPLIYIMRLCSFLVIIYAILDKNRRIK